MVVDQTSYPKTDIFFAQKNTFAIFRQLSFSFAEPVLQLSVVWIQQIAR